MTEFLLFTHGAIVLLGLAGGYALGRWHANAQMDSILTKAGTGISSGSSRLLADLKALIAKHEGKAAAPAPAGSAAAPSSAASTGSQP